MALKYLNRRIVSTCVIGLFVSLPAAAVQFEQVMSIGTQGNGLGQFRYVEDFDFTNDGKLLATDAAHAWVQVIDPKTGVFITRFGGKGDDDKHLEKPEGISVADNGDIFVADYTTGYVKVYDKNYNWKHTFSDYGSAPGENIKSEFTDIRDGRYYMPEAGNHRVSVWDMSGKFLFTFGEYGTQPGQLNNPEASKFNSKGELYVSDLKNDRIQVFDKDGNFKRTFASTGSGDGQLKTPAGIAFDANDHLYVAEIGNDRVSVFDNNDRFLTSFGSTGANDGEFGNLHGIIVDKNTGWIYVADTANNRIQVFQPK